MFKDQTKHFQFTANGSFLYGTCIVGCSEIRCMQLCIRDDECGATVFDGEHCLLYTSALLSVTRDDARRDGLVYTESGDIEVAEVSMWYICIEIKLSTLRVCLFSMQRKQ